MKTKTMLVAAALLSSAAVPALLAPAMAAKKEQAPTGPALSADFLKAAKPAQDAIAAHDFPTAETQLAAADTAAKSDDEKYTAAALRYDLEQGRITAARTANPNAPIDETRLYAPMTALLANAKTPADARGRFAFRLGVLSFNARKYADANRYLAQAQQLGYADAEGNIPLMLAQAKVESGDVQGGLTQIDQLIAKNTAAGQKTPENYYRYAFAKANARHMRPETVSWLARYAAAYPTKQTWRAVVINYGLQQGSVATPTADEKLDLYRLLRATGGLADQALYLEYADATRQRGLPAETLSVLQEGVATGKLQASSPSIKAAIALATSSARAEGSLAGLDTRARSAADGKLAYQTANAYLSQGNWAKAADLYKVAATKGGAGADADTVQTRLGIALARSGDKSGAQSAFAQVKGQNGAEIAQLWTAYLNQSAA